MGNAESTGDESESIHFSARATSTPSTPTSLKNYNGEWDRRSPSNISNSSSSFLISGSNAYSTFSTPSPGRISELSYHQNNNNNTNLVSTTNSINGSTMSATSSSFGPAVISSSSFSPTPASYALQTFRPYFHVEHIITQAKDSLISLSLRYGVSQQQIKKANAGLFDDGIFHQKTLAIPIVKENAKLLIKTHSILSLQDASVFVLDSVGEFIILK